MDNSSKFLALKSTSLNLDLEGYACSFEESGLPYPLGIILKLLPLTSWNKSDNLLKFSALSQ